MYPQGSIVGLVLFLLGINDLPSACEVFNTFLFPDDTNLIYRKNQDVFLLHTYLENLPKWFVVKKHVLVINETQTLTFNISGREYSLIKLHL